MKILLLSTSIFLLGCVSSHHAIAQESAKAESTKPQDSEVAAIRQGSKLFADAFNKHDAKAVAGFWTEDGEYVDETRNGSTLTGRETIEKAYVGFFKANPDAKISIAINSVKMLSNDAAIEDGRTLVEPVAPGTTGMARYTAFHVKVAGKWKMASVRDREIQAPAAYHSLKDLDWLVGSWEAEENGVKLESTCRWIANKTFLERRHSATHLDGSKSEGVQIIGWNPDAGHVQSWEFSSDGGSASGRWLPTDGGWTGAMQGVAGDGSVTSAVNYYIRIDDNAFTWRSTDRTRGGLSLPEADEVVIRRSVPVE
ncbi:YybH family protein [Thalassoglobus polymorphus]|uniref:SnoaL-like domain protein n=1 Tax=Thalassoglobus polymorphus TaxID=2527994 RepID=A0A517QKC8_9PLAN|nr:SgcJ/EcaC family oxidoreductase [Thalassoglobus polymorphus]QDT32088.1 SnoaL-like domain protein [Thalassoglobus polymorphus]